MTNITEEIKKVFVERLEELMNGKNNSEWSRELKIPDTTVSAWKLKRSLPSIEYLVMLAKKYNVTIDYLVGLED